MTITTSITTTAKSMGLLEVKTREARNNFAWDVCIASERFTVHGRGPTMEDAITDAVSKILKALNVRNR